jgi:hypothetical protein
VWVKFKQGKKGGKGPSINVHNHHLELIRGGKILGANFPCFFPKKDSPISIFF